MNKIKKKITVRFFSIDANHEFFEDFVAIHRANWSNNKPVRIFSLREKKHLMKIYPPLENFEHQVLFFSIVKERTTWQAKAFADGTLSGIYSNQGIIGDLYYYLVIPSRKIILGFTSGTSSTVRSTANTVLQQFRKDRTSKISLEPIANESTYHKFKELTKFIEMRFTLNPSLFYETDDDMPSIFRELKASPFMASSSKLELTVAEFGEDALARENILAAIDYLTDNECCTALSIKGIGKDGVVSQLDLHKTALTYSTRVEINRNFIDEDFAKEILLSALAEQRP